jgi:DNA sulfur modification protein DndC
MAAAVQLSLVFEAPRASYQAPAELLELVARGALFVANHSGGKDSQAMMIRLLSFVPRAQLLLVHAELGEVEWSGAVEHIEATAPGLPLVLAKSDRGLLRMVEERGMFPSPQQRQCTSDLKRTPIEREVRRFLKRSPRFAGLVVNCMGMRAQESSSRSKLNPFKKSEKNSKAGREWYEWLPIHELSEAEVFAMIREAGQKPHPIYAAGMSRFSCCFCIMASKADLTTAAKLNPGLYRKYVELEKRIGQTMSMSRQSLEEITGIAA